jgi:hypothetical protein
VEKQGHGHGRAADLTMANHSERGRREAVSDGNATGKGKAGDEDRVVQTRREGSTYLR